MPKTKTVVIIAALVAAIWLYRKYYMTHITPTNQDGTRQWKLSQVEAAFKKVAQAYGKDYARTLEQLFRHEVGHWETKPSGQWNKTLSPGMVAVEGKESTFPFGWSSLQKFVEANPKYGRGFGTVLFSKTSDGAKYYVSFPNAEAGIMYVAWFIKNIRGGRFGYWNSTIEAVATQYEAAMSLISTRFN
jgi:hypothetical protein